MTAAAICAVLWPLARRDARSALGQRCRGLSRSTRRDRTRPRGRVDRGQGGRGRAGRGVAPAHRRGRCANGAPSSAATRRRWRRRAVAVVALVVLPFGAAGLYLALGSPSLPDQPLAPRLAAARGTQSVDGLIAQVEAHLERNPEDGRGWEVIAPIYLRLGRFDDAVKARRNALRLNGRTAEREAALGEALVLAANGVVTAEAKAAFERRSRSMRSNVQARYFLGLAAEQDGDRAQAAATWRALIEAAPPDAPWIDFVRRARSPRRRARRSRCSGGPTRGTNRGGVGSERRATQHHDPRHGRAALRAAQSRGLRCRGMAAARSLLYGARRARQGARRGRRCAARARRRCRPSCGSSTISPRDLVSKAEASEGARDDPQATTPRP